MHKRVFAIALCLVMVSTVAATGAVSATPIADKSNIRTYNVYYRDPSYGSAGKATLNLETGHLVVNVNMNKIRASDPYWYEGLTRELTLYNPITYGYELWNIWTPNGDLVTMSLTADGTATLDTYLAPWSVTDPWIMSTFWDDPNTSMFL